MIKCKSCGKNKLDYNNNICEECYKDTYNHCSICKISLDDNYVDTLLKEVCPICLVDNIDIEEIFKDGYLHNIKEKQIEVIHKDSKFHIGLTIFFFSMTVLMLLIFKLRPFFEIKYTLFYSIFIFIALLFSQKTKSKHSKFTIWIVYLITAIIGHFLVLFTTITLAILTWINYKYTNDYNKEIPNKIKSLLRTNLISSQFNKYKGQYVSHIVEIIDFGCFAKENYKGDITKISDNDIVYLAKMKKIPFEIAKDYIKYCVRINYDNVISKILEIEIADKDLDSYYKSLAIYNHLIQTNKHVYSYDKRYETNIYDHVSASEYFEKMDFKIKKIKYLKSGNIDLVLNLKMPEVKVLNKNSYITGLIIINLYENNELVATGYVNGIFVNNESYNIVCKKIKEIKNLKNVEMKNQFAVLMLP